MGNQLCTNKEEATAQISSLDALRIARDVRSVQQKRVKHDA